LGQSNFFAQFFSLFLPQALLKEKFHLKPAALPKSRKLLDILRQFVQLLVMLEFYCGPSKRTASADLKAFGTSCCGPAFICGLWETSFLASAQKFVSPLLFFQRKRLSS
jgi:hypothetical protein